MISAMHTYSSALLIVLCTDERFLPSTLKKEQFIYVLEVNCLMFLLIECKTGFSSLDFF